MTINASNFDFRTKFQKLVTAANRSALISAFGFFCNQSAEAALLILWELTYCANKEFTFSTLGLNENLFSLKNAPELRNELRYQYSRIHPDFLDVSFPNDEVQKAFTNLSNKSTPIVANVVYAFCEKAVSTWEQSYINRTVFLLKADNEKLFFGGIRSLEFDYDEATYLKPLHKEIYELFKSLADYKCKNNILFDDKTAVQSKEELEAVGNSSSSHTSNEAGSSTVEFTSKTPETNKPLTASTILEHRDVIESYLDILKSLEDAEAKLREIGIDPNALVAKKDKVMGLLDAANSLIA